MVHLLGRVGKIIDELWEYAYQDEEKLSLYQYAEGEYGNASAVESAMPDWKDFRPEDRWGGYNRHGVFRIRFTIPERYSGRTVVLRILTGRENGWDAVNPQFAAYINGCLVQGLDVNHREIRISEAAAAGEEYTVTLLAFSGMEARTSTLEACLYTCDAGILKLHYHLKVPFEIAGLLQKEDKRRIDITAYLNEAVNLLDLRKPFSKEFTASVERAADFLEKQFYGGYCRPSDVTVYSIGHTHIDVAWRWTVGQTREKAVRSFSTVLELMKRYPDYTFLASQPQLYRLVKEDQPELYERIKERVGQGRWEAEGAMWLESDCNLTSGESLVRQILYGTRFLKKEFGVKSVVLWLPDVFGYSAALPQIMRKSGIRYFTTTKLSWNDTNQFPYDSFLWRGLDGSEVLSHLITTCDYQACGKSFFTTYNGWLKPSQIMGAWERYQQKDLSSKVLVAYGFGDGGGGPTEEMLENLSRLQRGIPGCPTAKPGKVVEFFEGLEEDAKRSKNVPKWVGELYFEYHRGTYTSMARNKKYNRKCEFLLQDAELFSVIAQQLPAGCGNLPYPKEKLDGCWEKLLLNQFHDILPGSSIREVYEDSLEDYKEIAGTGKNLLDQALDAIAANIGLARDSVVVFNQLGFVRDDIVELSFPQNPASGKTTCGASGEAPEAGRSVQRIAVYDQKGNCIPVQKVSDGWTEEGGNGAGHGEADGRVPQERFLFHASGIPSKGHKVYTLESCPAGAEGAEESAPGMKVTASSMQNDFFSIALDPQGNLISIFDRANGRELLKPGCRGNVLQAFEDKPLDYDAWDINLYYQEKMWEINEVESVRVVEQGPVRAALEIRRRFLDSGIVQRICIYRDIPRIDFKTRIDWREHQILLKAAFPLNIHAEKATYEIQFGNIERPTHWNTGWDRARFEVCGHKWADLSEEGFGVSLMNDCKYGHDVRDGVMRLTLLKSGIFPYPDADNEIHEFTYSIYPHENDWKRGGTVQKAYSLNCPPYSRIEPGHAGPLPMEYSLISSDGDNVVLDTVKKAEEGDNIVVRLYECHNRRSKIKLHFAEKPAKAWECDLLEQESGKVLLDGNSLEIELRPYEIRTIAYSPTGPEKAIMQESG